jgi:hypothetical protein
MTIEIEDEVKWAQSEKLTKKKLQGFAKRR